MARPEPPPSDRSLRTVTDASTAALRPGPILVAFLLMIAASYSLCAQCFLHTDPTESDDWQRAADYVVDRAEVTDGIRVHPTWSETPLPHLRDVGNLLHRHHHPLLEDFVGIERLLIISESGRTDDALDRLPFDADVDETTDFDTVTVLEVTIPPELRITTDLTHHLSEATVAYRGDGDESRCPSARRDDETFRCDGNNRDAEVRSVLMEVEDEPRRCIQAYPPSGDRHLAVETSIETADVLRIRAGLDRRAARLERGGDVIYRLYVDGEQIADERVDAHTSEWQFHDVPTDGPSAEVRIEVESVAPRPHHRRFCFNAWPLTDVQRSVETR